MIPVKHIILEKAFNVRDMGGFVNRDGRLVCWHKLIRSDGLANLTDKDWQTLYDLGIRTDLDLRSGCENEMFPDRPPEGILHISSPLQAEEFNILKSDEGAAAAFQKSLTNSYADMVLKTPHLLCKALSTLTERLHTGAVLFHCTAGKDRTGVLAATVLYLLNCLDADIIADYQVSRTYNREGIDRFVATLPNAADFKTAMESNPETIMHLLDIFHGMDLAAHLDKNGFSLAKQEELRGLLLTDI